jgi:hypothetical protein
MSFNIYQKRLLNNNCSILRIYNKINCLEYQDFYLGAKINESSLIDRYEYEVLFKYKTSNIDYFNLNSYNLVMLDETFKTYFIETTDNYMYMNFINLSKTDKVMYNNKMFQPGLYGKPIPNNSNPSMSSMINVFNSNINNEYTNILDIPRYALLGIYDTNLKPGIRTTELSQEYVLEQPTDIIIQFPIIDKNTDKIISPFIISNDPRNGLQYIPDISIYTRYPLYTKEIDAGKYIESSLQKYFDSNYSSISRKKYDYSKELFTDSDINVRNTEVENINEDGASKFIIEFDSNIKSLKISNFRKVYQTYTTSSLDEKKNLYLNEGFPYAALHIPDITISNGSLVKIEGLNSVDNILAKEFNKTHYAIIPKNYNITIRQLLPLPSLDYLNSDRNIFVSKGNPLTNDYIKNLYTDFINNTIKKEQNLDLTLDFIINRLLNTGELNYTNPSKFSINNIKNIKQSFNRSNYAINENEFLNNNLNRVYIDKNGNNQSYNTVQGFNNTQYSDSTRNLTGIEYSGSSLVNTSLNNRIVNELEKLTENTDEIFIKNGLETSFEENELFIKLSDMYKGINNNLIGRLTRIDTYSDQNGNHNMDYDLFSENGNNFKIGDLIIGLDSNTIGIILPSDYDYTNLPNDELKILGIGAYILNNQKEYINNFFESFYGLDSINNPKYLFSKLFMNKLNSWQIIENYTKSRFYIKLQSIPNTSRITGVIVNNLQIYVPDFFQFLEGEDTPLSLFGFQSSYYNNRFNYFKDNLQPYESLLINRSFLKRYNNRDMYLLIETKQSGNIQIDDKIYIEEHDIIYNNLQSKKNKFFTTELLEPYSSFLSKLETLYNTCVLNYNGTNKIVLPKNLNLTYYSAFAALFYGANYTFTDRDFVFDNEYSPYRNNYQNMDSSFNKKPIIFKNNKIARCLLHDEQKYNYSYTVNYRKDISANNLKDYEFKAKYIYNIPNFGIEELYIGGINILTSNYIDDSLHYLLIIQNGEFNNIFFKDISSNYKFNLTYTLTSSEAKNNVTYSIKLIGFRPTYAIKTLNTDASYNKYVSEYDTLGVYQRLMDNYIQDLYSIFYFDLNKANYLNDRFNYKIFRNRIIKLKVCPIDDCGFSYEPAFIGNIPIQASNTNYPLRRVAGYYKKLFPFHEYKFYKNWANNKLGDKNLVLSSNLASYARPQQGLTNEDANIKMFLPGMGVYLINQENITNNIISQARLPSSFYEYKTNFIGYVLQTSISSIEEYKRNYLLNSNTFSKTSNSLYSEYYIYLLVNPNLTTKDDMINLFDSLNKDYNHIVFDGNSNKDYTKDFLNVDGITIAKTKYRYNYDYDNSVFTIATKNIAENDGAYTLQENKAGTAIVQSSVDKSFVFYENNNYISPTIPIANIDGLCELFAGNIIIKKPKLNATLPKYDFQYRLACATITERPVFYSSDNSDNKIRLFDCGDLDFFYTDYLKNKTVVNYSPNFEKSDIQYLNNLQYIVDNPNSTNHKSNNFKERDCHARFIDNNYNNTYLYDTAGIYKNSDINVNNRIVPTISFNNGDDLILINSNYQLNSYVNNTQDYNKLQRNNNNTIKKDIIKLNKSLIKVISGCLFPINNLPHSKRLENNINTFINNTALIDYNYDSNIEKISKIPILGKTNGLELDIIGNNSDIYNYENINNLTAFYNTTKIDSFNSIISHILNETFTNEIIIDISIDKIIENKNSNLFEIDYNDLNNLKSNINLVSYTFNESLTNEETIPVKRLIGCLFITYTQVTFREYTKPYYNPINSEIAIIKDAEIIIIDGIPKVKITFKNYLKNLHELNNSSNGNINLHSIPYRMLSTENIDLIQNPTFTPYIAYDSSNNEIASSIYSWSADPGSYFIAIRDPSSYLIAGDNILINYGRTEYTNFSFESNTNEPGTLFINPTDTSKYNLNEIMEQNKIRSRVSYNTITGIGIYKLYNRPKVAHNLGSSIIILKDPLIAGTLPTNTMFIDDPIYKKNDTNLIERNLLSTQPFTILNKWYTKIYYNGSKYQDGTHMDSYGNPKKIFNYQEIFTEQGGKERISKYESKNVFIRGMKGLKLPFIDISRENNIITVLQDNIDYNINVLGNDNGVPRSYIQPIQPGYYTTKPQISEDWVIANIDSLNLRIKGYFDDINTSVLSPNSLGDLVNPKSKWLNYDNYYYNGSNYPYIVVEGLYLGYGGEIQERLESDITNTMINNDNGFTVSKVRNEINKLLITIKLPSIFNNFFENIKLDSNLNSKFKNRNDNISINIQSDFTDEFVNLNQDTDEYLSLNVFEIFGKDGRVVKKRINTPYNLNPNNYIFLTIPNLNHILPIQNNLVKDAFAKILLPGESNRVLYNTNVGGGKIYYDNLFNNLNELEIAFLTNDGYLFDFNGSEHSFSLEITEIIDKFEYINPRFGNIEI